MVNSSRSVLVTQSVMLYAMLFFFSLSSYELSAQVNNTSFFEKKQLFEEPGLYAGVNTFSFLRHKAFDNDITNGYSLLGYQMNPYIAWQPGARFRIDAGIYLLRDFGANGFRQISPTFSFTYQEPGFRMIMGNLDGSLNHRLIEPFQNFERVIDRRQETGIQFLVENERIFWDTWLDWRNNVPIGINQKESVFAGTSAFLSLSKDDEYTFGVPAQLTAQHFGARLDTTGIPATTLLNYAIGASLAWNGGDNSFMKQVKFEPYLAFYRTLGAATLPLESGEGYYLNFILDNQAFDFMVSYWFGQDFYSPEGGYLFSSLGNKWDNPMRIENKRELLILRFYKDIQIEDGLVISFRFEPYFDLQNQFMEYAGGLYFSYRPSFLLSKRAQSTSK